MKFSLFACFFLLFISVFGQGGGTHPVLLANGQAQMLEVMVAWPGLRQDAAVLENGRAFVLLQFREMPGRVEKEALAARGVELLGYVPNATWMAKVDAGLSAGELQGLGVKVVGKLPVESKMPGEMVAGEIPAHAGTAGEMRAKVLFWKQGNGMDLAARCVAGGLEVEQVDGEWAAVDVRGKWQDIVAFAAEPAVQFIEWPEPPIENEVLNELTLIQSNYISDNPHLGLDFNGSGVTIAVNEGGIFDTLQSPNVKGRIDRSLENGGVSGHKTGVGMRMASAGNIDPVTRGTAFGATLQSGGINFAVAASSGTSIVNNSFGYGCISGTVTYNSGAANNDNLVRTNPGFMVTYSAGNMGGSDCGYGAGAGWANITGLTKSGKNIFAVGSLGTNGALTGFSSRGPAWDGRILPDICTAGPGGTSHASPNLAGTWSQLIQAYRHHNGGATPPSGLLKAIVLNTADELENPGPDFKTGFGKVNARRAYRLIEQGNHLTASVGQGGSNVHALNVPANVRELKVMVYWTDFEATAGIVTKALVNDLDAVLQDPVAVQWQPWVLDPTPNATTLNQNAVRGADTLNNVEQITLANPAAGNYSLTVTGTLVPQGPQTYYVIYEYVYDEVFVTYPAGGEHFLPNTTERLRWESHGGSGAFDLSYSLDNGASWSSIATGLPATDRYYDWTVPDTAISLARIRVSRTTASDDSDTTFHIVARPQNLSLGWSCADSSLFIWDTVPGALSYHVYRLGANYMDFVAATTANSIVLNNFSATESEYVAVAAVKNGALSRRTIAIERPPANLNCVQNDLRMVDVVSPGPAFIPSCINSALTVTLKNNGVNSVSNIPVGYRINNGPVQTVTLPGSLASATTFQAVINPGMNLPTGTHIIETWTDFPGDPIPGNDTIVDTVFVTIGTSAPLQFSENFDGFINCPTNWGCASITCSLSQGWDNVQNTTVGDDIDWRTHSGATGTGSTGPSADHTSGNGKYLYLEGSGNGGSGCQNSTGLLYSPCIDLSGGSQPELSFWYHAYGSSIGELHVDVIAGGTLVEDVTAPVIGAQGNQWQQATADLSAFAGEEIVVVFRGSTGSGFTSDLAIDDVNIAAAPLAAFSLSGSVFCPNQTVSFTNSSTFATSYHWSISPSTFTYQNNTDSSSAQPDISFSSSGTYTIQLTATNAQGSHTQSLTVQVVPDPAPIYVNDADTTYCAGDSVLISTDPGPANIFWYQNNTHLYTGTDSTFTYTNVADGDLLYLITLYNAACIVTSDTVVVTVLSNTAATISPSACGSYTSPSGQVWTQSGAYLDTIPNAGGCDSLLSIQLTVDTLTATVSQSGSTLLANTSATTYQWVDCGNNFAAVAGATGQAFTPDSSGIYACVVTRGACMDTSTCVPVTVVGLEAGLLSAVRIYPNPTREALHIVAPAEVLELRVVDVLGKVVLHGEGETLQVGGLAAGVYYLEIRTEIGVARKRFVKE